MGDEGAGASDGDRVYGGKNGCDARW